MELTKTKAVITSCIIGIAVLPKALYHTSTAYLSAYDSITDYTHKAIERSLETIGLKQIEPEKTLSDYISHAANTYKLDRDLLAALISHESNNNRDAISKKGAISYAQIMPANAKRCGLQYKADLWDTEKNILCGAKILSEELKTYGHVLKALSAYNGGPGCVSKTGQESPCAETRKHNFETLKLYAQLKLTR